VADDSVASQVFTCPSCSKELTAPSVQENYIAQSQTPHVVEVAPPPVLPRSPSSVVQKPTAPTTNGQYLVSDKKSIKGFNWVYFLSTSAVLFCVFLCFAIGRFGQDYPQFSKGDEILIQTTGEKEIPAIFIKESKKTVEINKYKEAYMVADIASDIPPGDVMTIDEDSVQLNKSLIVSIRKGFNNFLNGRRVIRPSIKIEGTIIDKDQFESSIQRK
jgi:hypothetical protein